MDKQSGVIKGVMEQVETMIGVVPDVAALEVEVRNLVHDLPTGRCQFVLSKGFQFPVHSTYIQMFQGSNMCQSYFIARIV